MSQRIDRDAVRQVRAFNRMVADRIGALTDTFLGRSRPMGHSRTLWEVGRGAEVRELRARLGLDSGYASRVLQSLQGEGLVSIRPSNDDGRVRRVELTRAGRAEVQKLDRRAHRVAQGFLEPLTPTQRQRLVTAMAEVEVLMRASLITIGVEDPNARDARWCIAQYFAELNARFDAGFDPQLSISADAAELTPPAGAILIARLRGEPVGCGALKFHVRAPAELKRMWVAQRVRGSGLGRRLLAALERYAWNAGARAIRLETNRTLTEAIQLYRSSGYREVPRFNDEPYAHHWFEKRLAQQNVLNGRIDA